ncbi:hypothetical protein [Ruania alba]|nr:hypothetical protein [Ruania alba]
MAAAGTARHEGEVQQFMDRGGQRIRVSDHPVAEEIVARIVRAGEAAAP